MYDTIITTNFVSCLAFLVDATDDLTAVNAVLQKETSLLISNVGNRNALMGNARKLYATDGPALTVMLQTSTCGDNPCTSVQEIEDHPGVFYKGFRLKHMQTEMLRDLRAPFLSRLLAEINFCFPQDQVDKFHIFSPNQFPVHGVKLTNYAGSSSDHRVEEFGRASISYFVNIGWFPETTKQQLYREWVKFINSIVQDPLFPDLQKSKPEIFWPTAFTSGQVDHSS